MSARTMLSACLFLNFGSPFLPSAAGQTLGTAFTYQGRLIDGGNPANGSYDLQFSLNREESGGSMVAGPVCIEDVDVQDGLFTVLMDFGPGVFGGDALWLEIEVRADSTPGNCASGVYSALTPLQELTPAPNALFAMNASAAANATRLDGQAGEFYQNASNLSSGTLADAQLSNNVALLNAAQTFSAGKTFSAPPSFVAAGAPFTVSNSALVTNLNADRLDGLEASAFLQSIPVPLTLSGPSGTHVIRGENTSAAAGASGVYGVTTAASGVNFGVFGLSASTTGQGVTGVASATSGTTYGVYGENASTAGTSIYGLATAATGATRGVYGESASTSGRGVFGVATAASGTTYGGRFVSDSTAGQGVLGYATAPTGTTYGVRGVSDSTDGRAVFGEATATSGTNYGVYGESASNSGSGVYGTGRNGGYFEGTAFGVYGAASSSSFGSTGVYANATATSGTTFGVRAINESSSGTAINGIASSQTGNTYGVWGTSHSPEGVGVVGSATANSGSTAGVYGESDSPDGRGVWGVCTVGGGNYGVYGGDGGNGSYAVYASGDFGASGTKAFRIDHPDDPANKYLLHYAAESPEVINFYSETVTLDERGEAVVELPNYFAKINTRPRYQLTAVGAPMPMLHVAAEIDEAALTAGAEAEPGQAAPACSFRIAGGAPGARVSWEVKAVRNDRWAQQRGAPVEIEKRRLEKGTYQHPELYGQPPEKGMNYDAERERQSPPSTPTEHAQAVRESEME